MPPRPLLQLGQLLLNFLDGATPAQAVATPIKSVAPQAAATPENPENTLKTPAADLLTLPLIHPQATHRIALHGQVVAYQLVRSPRRSVGFVISTDGLQVRANRSARMAEIERLLLVRSDWVLQHWRRQLLRQAATASEFWAAGSQHGLHGVEITLQLGSELPRGQHQLQGENLVLALPADASAEQIENAALQWYGQYAQAHFSQRLRHYAAAMGVHWTHLRLSKAKTRWGLAKSDGSIRLHWRLVQLAPELLDYVVVHELAHLREMNHSPRFWAIVAQHCPDYHQLRLRLKSLSL